MLSCCLGGVLCRRAGVRRGPGYDRKTRRSSCAARCLARDAARVRPALSSVRRRPAVWQLPEGCGSMPGLRRGAASSARRRCAGVFHHRCGRPHYRRRRFIARARVCSCNLGARGDLAAPDFDRVAFASAAREGHAGRPAMGASGCTASAGSPTASSRRRRRVPPANNGTLLPAPMASQAGWLELSI